MKLVQEIVSRLEKILQEVSVFRRVFILEEDHEGLYFLKVEFYVRKDRPFSGTQHDEFQKKLFLDATTKFKSLIDEGMRKISLCLGSEGHLKTEFIPLPVTSVGGFVTDVSFLLRDEFERTLFPENEEGSSFEGNHLVFHLGFCVRKGCACLLRKALDKACGKGSDSSKANHEIWVSGHRMER